MFFKFKPCLALVLLKKSLETDEWEQTNDVGAWERTGDGLRVYMSPRERWIRVNKTWDLSRRENKYISDAFKFMVIRNGKRIN